MSARRAYLVVADKEGAVVVGDGNGRHLGPNKVWDEDVLAERRIAVHQLVQRAELVHLGLKGRLVVADACAL